MGCIDSLVMQVMQVMHVGGLDEGYSGSSAGGSFGPNRLPKPNLALACKNDTYVQYAYRGCRYWSLSWAISRSFASIKGSNCGISTALLPCSCLRNRNKYVSFCGR